MDINGNATQLTTNQLKRKGLKGINDSWTYTWDATNLGKMKKGKAPERAHPMNPARIERMELSHETVPQRNATNTSHLTDVIQRWPQEHDIIDNYRNVGANYPF